MNIHSHLCVTCNNHKNGSIINMSRCKQCTKTIPNNKIGVFNMILKIIILVYWSVLAFILLKIKMR